MSVLWHTGVCSGKITMNQYVAITSTNASQIFNMYPKKGVIAVGSDADIVIIDPNVRRTISKSTHYQRIDSNIWEGVTVTGVTVMTIINGEIAWEAYVENGVALWEKGKFNLISPNGRYIHRPTFGFSFEGINEQDQSNKKEPIERK